MDSDKELQVLIKNKTSMFYILVFFNSLTVTKR